LLYPNLKLADTILILDNSFDAQRIIARKNIKDALHIEDKTAWLKMQELADG